MMRVALFVGLCFGATEAGIFDSITGAVSSVKNRVKDGIASYMPRLGTCPEIPAQENRAEDIDDFLGSWYVQSALNLENLQGQARYMSAIIVIEEDTDTLTINAQQFNDKTQQWGHLVARARVANESLDEFTFEASFKLPYYGQVGGKYTVIKSDFLRFGVVHGCGSFLNLLYYDVIWLVSREQKLTQNTQNDFDTYTQDVLSKMSIDHNQFKKIIQKNTAEPDD